MKLFRLCVDQIRLHEPLPWSVRNEPGHLLLSKGYVLTDPQQLASLLERGMYVDVEEFQQHLGTQTPREEVAPDPFVLWTQINKRASTLLNGFRDNPAFKQDAEQVSGGIRKVIKTDVEAGMFEMLFEQPDSYAVSHSVQTAFVACLAAERFGLSDNERQLLTNAALTMNIGMLEMQNTLARQTTPPTTQQRAIINAHPRMGRQALEQAGISDPDWLNTVEHHHVTTDGKGLPQDQQGLSQLACMIHYADVYLAKISARASRAALPANVAARELYVNAGGANNPYAATIIKEIGIYPPGSCVRLANGDAALVVRKGASVHTPFVYSLGNASGIPYKEPTPRDTAQAMFKVMDALPKGHTTLRVSRQQLFGYETAKPKALHS